MHAQHLSKQACWCGTQSIDWWQLKCFFNRELACSYSVLFRFKQYKLEKQRIKKSVCWQFRQQATKSFWSTSWSCSVTFLTVKNPISYSWYPDNEDNEMNLEMKIALVSEKKNDALTRKCRILEKKLKIFFNCSNFAWCYIIKNKLNWNSIKGSDFRKQVSPYLLNLFKTSSNEKVFSLLWS